MSELSDHKGPTLLEEEASGRAFPPNNSNKTSDGSTSDKSGSDIEERKPSHRRWMTTLVLIFGILCLAVVLAAVFLMKSEGIFHLKSIGSAIATPNPSLRPTKAPFKSPLATTGSPIATPGPSLRPTKTPSESPTSQPTPDPTFLPSANPSISPSISATVSPTISPTASPTRLVMPEGYNFRLKMHWQREFFWQEEDEERRWCLECTRCTELTGSGEPLDVCRDPNNNDGTDCELDDQLWIQNCNGWNGSSGNTQFEIVRHSHADQIKILNKDLCVERVGNRFLNLQRCNEFEEKQGFVGFDPAHQPFDIRPVVGGDDGKTRCWSQHHWPKKYEMLSLEECDLAYNWDTALWEAL
jgi:hypothetical protein